MHAHTHSHTAGTLYSRVHMVSMTGSTARPTAQTPRRAVSELPHLCVRLCFFRSRSHSHSHWHSHFFSNVAHTHTRAHAHMCMTALRHMYVFCIRFGFGFEFWIWNRCQSFDGFPFFVFFAASSASFSICLINIRHSRQQCDFSRLSSLFISVCLSPWPFFCAASLSSL